MTCRGCQSPITNEKFELSEQFFGGSGSHRYVECETCGTVLMFTFPVDVAAGFRVIGNAYDGHAGFFAMGEAARRGLPFDGKRRPSRQHAAEMFSAAEMARFDALAAERNAAGDGDTAAFYLRLT